MKYLLDTCVLLWALENNTKKLTAFIDIINDPHVYMAVSVVSYWEISIKRSLGKISAPNNLIEVVEESGFEWISLETRHIKQLEKLPSIHTDPFDRLLIAQAQTEQFKILTADKHIQQYF